MSTQASTLPKTYYGTTINTKSPDQGQISWIRDQMNHTEEKDWEKLDKEYQILAFATSLAPMPKLQRDLERRSLALFDKTLTRVTKEEKSRKGTAYVPDRDPNASSTGGWLSWLPTSASVAKVLESIRDS